MSAFKLVLAAILAVALVRPSIAGEMDMYGPNAADEPTGASMVADALVARPLYAAATAFGAAVFLVTLPFSALGGNVDEAASELVTGPARGLLVRCLGCTQPVHETYVERPGLPRPSVVGMWRFGGQRQ
jgi:hypothetical protein